MALKIAFTTILPKEGFKRLVERGFCHFPLVICDLSTNDAEWTEAEVLVSTFDYKVPRELIESMPNLRLIANFGAGFNNIDLDACRERGIRVTNTPQPVIEPTAELAFALMIDVARRVSEFDRAVRSQLSSVSQFEGFGVMKNLSHSLYGKTLGILGMGRIGQALARRAIASGMRIIYHNRKELRELESEKWKVDVIRSAQYVDFQTLLQDSDYLSLNLPYTPEVHHIIGKPELGMMKRTAYLINTARGAHVDEAALIEALKSGIIAGAALDVYEHEPQISRELMTLPNVVLSPHTGTGTWEGRIDMCENVTDNIIAFIENDTNKMNIVL
ncbi:MAG: NAD(P)-binding domain-containing protein [Paludibacteraceae bacterium]|nr:NAD(P)-binding domain-containing protein [Paludibacteraceae bacterium]